MDFENNSKLEFIDEKSFYNSKIKKLNIPEKAELSHGCFINTLIEHINISPNNKNYVFYHDELLLGKSDLESEEIDTLIYAKPVNETVFVPKNVKYLAKYCFAFLKKIKSIEFEDISNVISIGKYAFNSSELESITIPPHVKHLKKSTFNFCRNLKEIKITEDSELETIEEDAFSGISIEHLYIPSKLHYIDTRNFDLTSIVVSPKNNNYITFNNKILLGKSQINIDQFYVLLLVCNDVKILEIPSYIKYIKESCIRKKNKLKKIIFNNDSDLVSIEKYAFENALIEELVIPSKCINIGKSAFECNKFLKKIIFAKNSKIKNISEEAFSKTSIKSIIIPSTVEHFQINAFTHCNKIRSIELLASSLIIENKYSIANIKIQIVSIPNASFVKYSNRYFSNPKFVLFVKAKSTFNTTVSLS